ncbi:hypothetical protein JYT71_01135 [Acidimicrobiaceae bacterium AH-315-P05]|nr:hypothetical protein [Acidimicrobiaceae bacterium AH-315-P05]
MSIAVVVNAFNRPLALARLLRGLSECEAPDGTELVISVDGGGSRRTEVLAVANGFDWEGRSAKVIEQDDCGLVGHFRRCGDMVDELGPIVLLEDDLVVGPTALRFAEVALDFTADDERVAGVCLSTPWFDGFRHQRFEPLLDGSAAVYLKVPWFHGMAWTPEQWHRHRVGADVDAGIELPLAFSDLGGDEWFPDATRALIEHDNWYLAARKAHAVNFGDVGTHFDEGTAFFQQPLVQGSFRSPVLLHLDDPDVVPYDEYLEPDSRWLAGRVKALSGLDVTIDLRGVRSPRSITTEWVVTSRPSSNPLTQWGAAMVPLEQNLISDVAGESLTLCRTADMSTGKSADRWAELTVLRHAHRGRPPGIRGAIRRRAIEIRSGRSGGC